MINPLCSFVVHGIVLILFAQKYMWGPRGVRQLLTNLQFKKVGGDLFFIFTSGLVVFLFFNCLNLHISFIQHGICPQYKTCFAISVDGKFVIQIKYLT